MFSKSFKKSIIRIILLQFSQLINLSYSKEPHYCHFAERLADCLRLPQAVPSLQSQVFLCFRVLLIRMSPHHVTSLWPVVISELVQAMLHMEHQLGTGSEQFRWVSHIKVIGKFRSSRRENGKFRIEKSMLNNCHCLFFFIKISRCEVSYELIGFKEHELHHRLLLQRLDVLLMKDIKVYSTFLCNY